MAGETCPALYVRKTLLHARLTRSNVGLYYHKNISKSDRNSSEQSFTQLDERRNSFSSATLTCRERLKTAGLEEVSWEGRCEADKVTTGRYTVPPGKSGMYTLCFGMNARTTNLTK